uniref:Uncharacterized protein n=1 Tax=Cacopsylla melanoneura TaxID=428564 RepID=A0A8D8ZGU9_9HEMI
MKVEKIVVRLIHARKGLPNILNSSKNTKLYGRRGRIRMRDSPFSGERFFGFLVLFTCRGIYVKEVHVTVKKKKKFFVFFFLVQNFVFSGLQFVFSVKIIERRNYFACHLRLTIIFRF